MNNLPLLSRCRQNATAVVCLALIAATATLPAQVSAKDLYVATSGSDSVSYAANNQGNPWRTLSKGVTSLQPGDKLIIRGGTYRPSAGVVLDTRNGSGAIGSASSPIRVTSFQGENVTIDLASVTTWLTLFGANYWEISDLSFINTKVAVEIGGTALFTTNTTIRNNSVQMNRGGDNSAAFRAGNSAGTIIDGNIVVGPGNGSSVNRNTGCVYMDRTSSIKVLNNVISGCPNGIHYKHANSNTPGADIEIAYNYITNAGRSGIHYNGNYGHIHDNILGQSGSITMPLPNGVPGGHNNLIEHNTFVGATLNFTNASGNLQNNVVRNNIFANTVLISQYQSMSHTTAFDFNLHKPGAVINEFGTVYDLQNWRSHDGSSQQSIEGTAQFVGGQSPSSVGGFRLASGIPGVRAASDGTDLGARIDLFGSSPGTSLVRPQPPQSVTAN